MTNLKTALAAAGLDFSHVVQVNLFLANIDDLPAHNAVWAEYFPMSDPPVRSCIEAARLPKGALLQIAMVAVCNN